MGLFRTNERTGGHWFQFKRHSVDFPNGHDLYSKIYILISNIHLIPLKAVNWVLFSANQPTTHPPSDEQSANNGNGPSSRTLSRGDKIPLLTHPQLNIVILDSQCWYSSRNGVALLVYFWHAGWPSRNIAIANITRIHMLNLIILNWKVFNFYIFVMI